MDAKKHLEIFVVEDNKIYNRVVCEYLKKQNFKNITSFNSGKECIKSVMAGARPHIVIQDYHLEDSNGIEVLINVKKYCKDSEFIFLTGNEDMDVAVNTIKYGAFDYIIKDNDLAFKKVEIKIGKIIQVLELKKRNRIIRQVMIVIVIILFLIVAFSTLHMVFNAFGIN